MEEGFTEFVEFCGWYKCRSCGINERFIPSQCPVCGRTVSNYQQKQTDRLREIMQDRRDSEDEGI